MLVKTKILVHVCAFVTRFFLKETNKCLIGNGLVNNQKKSTTLNICILKMHVHVDVHVHDIKISRNEEVNKYMYMLSVYLLACKNEHAFNLIA